MRRSLNHLAPLSFVLVAAFSSAAMAWPPGGVEVAPGSFGSEPGVLLGRDGGAFAFWSDRRWRDQYADIYGQLLSRHGQVAIGWPDTGLMIARAEQDQRIPLGLSHPDGSFIVGWSDTRDFPVSRYDQYITRVLPEGGIDPAWPRHGFRVTDRADDHVLIDLEWAAPDTLITLGYAVISGVSWYHLQTLAITPLAPQRLWSASGVLYGMHSDLGGSAEELAPDGAGGAYFMLDPVEGGVWRPGARNETDLHVMRVGRDGQPGAGWESGPKPFAVAPGGQWYPSILPDGEGGLYVAWADERDGAGLPNPEYSTDIRLQRLTAAGVPHADWPADGLVVNDAPGWQYLPSVAPDGAGGVYVAWDDITIGVTRVQRDGTFAPGWPVNGIQISDLFAWTSNSRMVPDGLGGVYVLFDNLSSLDLFLQHVLPSGMADPGWPSTGYFAGPAADGDIVGDGAGGCYVAFRSSGSIRVSRYSADGPVPVKLAEATIEAEPGRVHLEWRGAEAAAAELTVQRRVDGIETWTSLGSPTARGRDVVEYDDTAVEPGGRYAYRLTRGAELMSEESWITVPASAVFALAGAQPNPARASEAALAFTLSGGAPARLEVLDLAGRRVHVRSLEGLGAGRHTLSLAGARLAPGVHWLRLTEGAQVAQARMVVVR